MCGAVRYTVRGAPRFSGICNCRDCQKATGSAFSAFMMYPVANFELTGETRAYDHICDAGTPSRRNFCPTCGSTVFGGGEEGGEDVNIYAGTLDDPDVFEPKMQIFVRSRRQWAQIPADKIKEYDAM
ncbi:MAG: GFA family protein [Hyphomicrobiaceae bacterium]|nr:GFA family protein [Hyphomicrobiaceae bacterium]